MANRQRRFRRNTRVAPKRGFTWIKPATLFEDFTGPGFKQQELLSSVALRDAVMDREATLVRARGLGIGSITLSGDMSTNALWRLCFGVIVSHDEIPDLPDMSDIDSSGEFFIFCCILLSKGAQGNQIECWLDNKAMRKFDTRRDSIVAVADLALVQGTNSTGRVSAGLDLRIGVLLS